MKIGIMQPYFFPYIGYFSLIRATDFWVVFDDVQFIRHGWIERNKILNSNEGWQYIKVPLVKTSRKTKIKDIKIRMDENWDKKILAQLTCYKNKAPYYNTTIELLKHIFQNKWEDITSLNVFALKKVCTYLNIPFEYQIYSKAGYDVRDRVTHPGEWALLIAKHYQANQYINPCGGKEIFIKDQYYQNGIDVKFLQNHLPPYNQRRTTFESGLSIIDVLMYNSPEKTVNMIDAYTLI